MTSNNHGPLSSQGRGLELLAPAKNLACGLAAISHGADAVYIGADHFGARAAAGNSVDDIATLCTYAHRYGAKVYVTVNTIIYEDELAATQDLITSLARVGVDALLVQDMATLAMRRVALSAVGHAPVLHASTQCDTRTAEKVAWLRSLGFTRAVLARELSIDEIRAIHSAVPDIELEVFVHGALCVSYSGQCYASQHLFHRSANRGECAQVCRMKYDLVDANGDTVVHDRYLLSMKDFCQVDNLEALADAGASSFKIEGRLKDETYVKNVVAAYSQRLDAIIRRHPDRYHRTSWGRVDYAFQPSLEKTFNRGYTDYFAKGRHDGLATMFTPKALGQFVGTVHKVQKSCIDVRHASGLFANGDGLCFLNDAGELEGFRVNRAEGPHLYPFHTPKGLRPGMSLYRNQDVAFEKTLSADTTRRVIPLALTLATTATGFALTAAFHGFVATATADFAHEKAQKPQTENIRRQLAKLGGTIFEAADITISDGADSLFIPSSILAQLRRDVVDSLLAVCDNAQQHAAETLTESALQGSATKREHLAMAGEKGWAEADATVAPDLFWSKEYREHPYLFNVANHMARDFYHSLGFDITESALEVREPQAPVVMQCRYCICYELGFCVRRGGKKPTWREPLHLRLGDGNTFRLDFRCDECQMNLVADKETS